MKPLVKFSHVQPHLPPRVHKKVLLPQQMQFRKLEQSFQDPRALNVSHNFEGKRREHSRRSSSGIRVYSKEKRF